MAEEVEGGQRCEASGGVDPAAVTLALGGASREEADAFLKDQRRLIHVQAQELAHELSLPIGRCRCACQRPAEIAGAFAGWLPPFAVSSSA